MDGGVQGAVEAQKNGLFEIQGSGRQGLGLTLNPKPETLNPRV